MVTDPTRARAWEQLFGAEARMRYLYAQAARFQRRDDTLHHLVMAFSSATLVSLFSPLPLAAQAGCAVATTLLSVSTGVLKLGVRAKDHATAAGEMSRVATDLKKLWAACEADRLSDEEAIHRLDALKERSRAIGQPLATTRVQHKLVKKSYDEAATTAMSHA